MKPGLRVRSGSFANCSQVARQGKRTEMKRKQENWPTLQDVKQKSKREARPGTTELREFLCIAPPGRRMTDNRVQRRTGLLGEKIY